MAVQVEIRPRPDRFGGWQASALLHAPDAAVPKVLGRVFRSQDRRLAHRQYGRLGAPALSGCTTARRAPAAGGGGAGRPLIDSGINQEMTDVPNTLNVGAFSSILFEDGRCRGKPVPSPLVWRVAIAPAIAEDRFPEHPWPLSRKQLS